MKMMEKAGFVFLVAGIGLFAIAFVSLAVVPAMMTDRIKSEALIPTEVPRDFREYYSSAGEYEKALYRGRDRYIAEACWHCHSQYVRPISNESIQYGPVSTAGEYQTKLQLPQLLGTRRVGPDLIRLAGKYSNDWHFAHLYNPRSVAPLSVMPSYRWLFDESGPVPKPKQSAIDLVAYLQWLGSWIETRHETVYGMNMQNMPPTEE